MKNKIRKILDTITYKKKINTLENKIEMLENIIKDELYSSFTEGINNNIEVTKLKKDNKRLREKIKTLQEIIKEK